MPSLRRVDEEIPRVDGLRLVERVDQLEAIGRGEVWRARVAGGLAGDEGRALPGELPGVGECRLRLLRMPVDEGLRARALTLARDLTAMDEPGLLAVRQVRKAYDGVALVYGHGPDDATGLHEIARRRLLRAGEVVTLGVGLSWALAHAHAAGIVHGRLADADVLIGADGRPVLTGMGVRGVLGAAGEPAADVRALERMLGSLLDRETPSAAKVERALAHGSTSAAGLAALLAAAAPAVPIHVGDAAPSPGEAPAGRRARSRGVPRFRRPAWLRPRILVAGAGIVLLGALAGWATAPGPHAAARHSQGSRPSVATAGGPDWRQVLTTLDRARSAAFARPDVAALSAVDAPGGAAYRYDAAAVSSMRARGVHAGELRLVLESVAVESASPRRAVLRVTDRLLPYQLRDATGTVVSNVAGRASATHRIELAVADAGGSGWRVVSVTDPAVVSS
jgi:hypothetical protein